ncbi:DUF1992 domain-containing protein [Thalassococcus profundi]|uniref:DUF1992 domain-containing protein n=1 Tax=Thalassococcus profundi TaxID=2282382 RepID=A0A369TFW5_9RHOB|nr:DUF1992 domain-containing protein [Thalassococcus profundi]RDD64158.1 DUF1992 domain-containing protein [Thalassococcus profundi]
MKGFERFVEQQIQEALEDGRLSGLPGEGKPLPQRSGAAFVDAVESAGYAMMTKSGALPEELRLRRDLAEARAAFAACDDPEERRRLMARITDLDLRHNMTREKRIGRRF